MNLTGNPYLIPFDVNRGVLNSVSRFLLGVALVVTWKTLAKPIVFTILPPIYKAVGVYLPRRSYISTAHTQTSTRKIRSTSMSNDSNMGIGDINNFIKGVTDHNKKDEVGPETEIDYYEMLSYSQNQNSDNTTIQTPPKYNSGVFKYRYDVEIVGRLIIYAGISITAVWTFAFASDYLNL